MILQLFIIEGDYLHLRKRAHEFIDATEAYAKVAAASALSSYSTVLPSVAVTPMAKSYRLKNTKMMDPKFGGLDQAVFRENATSKPGNTTDNNSPLSAIQNQHSGGVQNAVGGNVSKNKFLSKSKDLQ